MSVTAVILAAGKGTRMKSDKPKVLHEVCGRPMLEYVLNACRQAGADRLLCVIGHESEQLREAFSTAADITWIEQTEQLGTGHAVMVCSEQLEEVTGPVLVLAGDGPLIRGETLEKVLATHAANNAALTLATCILDDPGAYGRIVRDEQGRLEGIVEYLDADESQRAIQEVNVSLYCFDADRLNEVLGRLTNDNAKGEYYLTDTLALLRDAGYTIAAAPEVEPGEVLSVNDRVQLAEVNGLMQQRVLQSLMREGVTIEQPATTWIDPQCEIGADCVIRPNTVLDGRCRIGAGCVIGPFVHLRNEEVAAGATVEGRHG
jgi:bifunctional UDP-N-acetylglucosamine pyrophosphorylase/glucosamine-1-phosphate N-acetyltransferase